MLVRSACNLNGLFISHFLTRNIACLCWCNMSMLGLHVQGVSLGTVLQDLCNDVALDTHFRCHSSSFHWKELVATKKDRAIHASFIFNKPVLSVIGKPSVGCLTLIRSCFSWLPRQLCARRCWSGYKSSGGTCLLGSHSRLTYSTVSASVCSRQWGMCLS